jgi:hypothetical protein
MAGTKTLIGVALTGIILGGTVTSGIDLSSGKIDLPKAKEEISVAKDKMIPASISVIGNDTIIEPEKIIVVSDGEMIAHVNPGDEFFGAFIMNGVITDNIKFAPTVSIPETDCWLAQARITFTQVRKP